ncbi:MAG: TatD family hydrolase, partial [Clostridia bacterium]|nr:TatD family hydrolase [Clostridia bacterium]
MLFDTHAHLTDPAFDEDREQIIASLPDAGVSHVILPSCTVEDAKAAQKIANHHSNIYFAAGFHPGNILEMEYDHIDRIAALVSDPKCVGIGEIGLDYYWEKDPVVRDTQRYWFEQQLHLAFELGVPVIVHDREAHQDCFDAVRKAGVQGVFHCYSSAAEMAMELVKIGFYCSFTGVITYQGARKSLQAIQALPIERILLETDSPYLAPVPYRGKRNDSSFMYKTAEKLAEVRGVSVEHVARVTCENA